MTKVETWVRNLAKGKLHQVALKEEVLMCREDTIGASPWISAFGQNLLNISINDL